MGTTPEYLTQNTTEELAVIGRVAVDDRVKELESWLVSVVSSVHHKYHDHHTSYKACRYPICARTHIILKEGFERVARGSQPQWEDEDHH